MAGPTAAALSLTVLGSGGPFTHPERASAGYLVASKGKPRILVDAGGGTFERLGRIGADPAELDGGLLTHLHIDHSGGLPPVVFAAFMQGRTKPLPVAGPSGRDDQPGWRHACELLFGPAGAWRYLHSFEGFGVEAIEVPEDAPAPAAVVLGAGETEPPLEVAAVGVAHGMMPAVAYRITLGDHSVVISGDLEGESTSLAALARGCDLLVHDQALPRRDMVHGHLHPPPEETGANAAAAGARQLLLSHLMPPAERELDEVVARVASRYDGRIDVAHDLMTIAIG